jgi:hypothetical protein
MKGVDRWLLAFTLAAGFHAQAQTEWLPKIENKGRGYFYWGYNRANYSKSDVHFYGPDYDFTIYGVTAHDRPSPLNKDYVSIKHFSVPQFNARAGYFVSDRWAVSFGEDHMKYVLDRNQYMLVSGLISSKASEKYAGTYLRQPMRMAEDFVQFEHTDGLNLFSLDVEHHLPLLRFFNQKIHAEWMMGAGGIFVIPRTDAKLFGVNSVNEYHLGGYCMNAKSAVSLFWKNKLFVMAQIRAGYMTMRDLVLYSDNGTYASHNFSFGEYVFVVGTRFGKGAWKRAGKQ